MCDIFLTCVCRCGVRGGYCEFFNLDPDIKDQMIKFIAKTCAPVSGQVRQRTLDAVVTELLVNYS